VRSPSVNGSRFTLSPRYDGSVTPSLVSRSAERGLAYWPAMRPMRTTGRRVPWTSTRLICIKIFSFAAIESDRQSSKLSAQSPPCSTNASPRAAAASCVRSPSISHDVTSGGSRCISANTRSNAAASG
jgi:hypothetical protein